jgi:hypothetical protein
MMEQAMPHKERATRLRCEARLTRVEQSMSTRGGERHEARRANEFVLTPLRTPIDSSAVDSAVSWSERVASSVAN